MSSSDTAFKHLIEVASPENKNKPVPEKIKIWLKREAEDIEAGKKEPSNIFDMLKSAVEAKSRGESLKIKLVNQSMEMESEPNKDNQGLGIKAMEIQQLGGAFQYQGLLFGEVVKAMAISNQNSINAVKDAHKEANNVDVLKTALKAMKQSNEMLVDRLKDRELYIEQLQKELSLGFKREKIAHAKDLKTMTDKHFLERQVLELEMMLNEHESIVQNGEEGEEKEENLSEIDQMVKQVEDLMDKAPQYVETIEKAKSVVDIAKGLFSKDKDKEEKNEATK